MFDINKLQMPGVQESLDKKSATILCGTELISVFVNRETGQLDVTLDEANPETGHFDYNIEWISVTEIGAPLDDAAYLQARKQIQVLMKVSFNRQVKKVMKNDKKLDLF